MIAIGQASRESGVHVETIRFYEKSGLLPAPERSHGGRRMYAPRDVRRLRFIRRCRELGFATADIAALMALAEGTGSPDCAAIRAIATAHAQAIRDRMATLADMAATLDDLARRCEAGASACPIAEDLMQG